MQRQGELVMVAEIWPVELCPWSKKQAVKDLGGLGAMMNLI